MRVRFFATLRALVGSKTVEVQLIDGATVLDLAHALAALHPGLAEHFFDADDDAEEGLARTVHFMIDGRNCRWLPEGALTVLRPDQAVDVFPPVAGG